MNYKGKEGIKIERGDIVRCRIGGCLGNFKVSRIKPRKNIVVVIPGSYFKEPDEIKFVRRKNSDNEKYPFLN